MKSNFILPTVLVVFGATGDLMARYITPALFDLHLKGQLPEKFRVIGIGRRDYNDEIFRQSLMDKKAIKVEKASDSRSIDSFLKLFEYYRADFTNLDEYAGLGKVMGKLDESWSYCANKLYYLSVAPAWYETILHNLHDSGLAEGCGSDEGWTRVLIEKPFGSDHKSAEELDMLLGKLFKEEQIYRIDHYLAKDVVQNIMTFRFANTMFEPTFSNEYIDSINLYFNEELNVSDRGAFYDGVGALRDVGGTHLLQLLSLIMMDKPDDLSPASIREKKTEVLSALELAGDIPAATERGQYKGYVETNGVDDSSTTETSFRIHLKLNTPRWEGVTITLEGGKAMADTRKEAVVTYKHPEGCLCPPGVGHINNKVVFNIVGSQSINLTFMVKKSSYDYAIQDETIVQSVKAINEDMQAISEHEQLLIDAFRGDQTRFVSTEEVMEMWKIVDPIIEAWQKGEVSLTRY